MTLFVTHNFLEDMALVLCVAALAVVICQVLRQPLVVSPALPTGGITHARALAVRTASCPPSCITPC